MRGLLILLPSLLVLSSCPRPGAGTCTDGQKNGEESDVDCGGTRCGLCAVDAACLVAADCQWGVCRSGRCVPASCRDRLLNAGETGVDCGGTCGPCREGEPCGKATDCNSGVCSAGACAVPGCADGTANGLETGPDCGGPGCPGCATGLACRAHQDCLSDQCLDGLCVDNCLFPGLVCGGACVNRLDDRAHCGACGTACPVGQACLGGTCAVACGFGTNLCDGGCVDTAMSLNHCGACGVQCDAGQRCLGGACGVLCAPNQALCAGQCVTLATDRLHCGFCGVSCPGNQICVSGQCVGNCAPPLIRCGDGGTCFDPRFDPDHCGNCENTCPQAPNAGRACGFQGCTRGACVPGFADCNAFPLDGCEAQLAVDPMNCGTCAVGCGPGFCDAGVCQSP